MGKNDSTTHHLEFIDIEVALDKEVVHNVRFAETETDLIGKLYIKRRTFEALGRPNKLILRLRPTSRRTGYAPKTNEEKVAESIEQRQNQETMNDAA